LKNKLCCSSTRKTDRRKNTLNQRCKTLPTNPFCAVHCQFGNVQSQWKIFIANTTTVKVNKRKSTRIRPSAKEKAVAERWQSTYVRERMSFFNHRSENVIKTTRARARGCCVIALRPEVVIVGCRWRLAVRWVEMLYTVDKIECTVF